MNKKTMKVGDVVIEIPDDAFIATNNIDVSKDVKAERGEEVLPNKVEPHFPSSGDFVGRATFQVKVYENIGKSEKKWANTSGAWIFLYLPFIGLELIAILPIFNSGNWILFVFINSVIALSFYIDRKTRKNKSRPEPDKNA